MTVLIVDDQTSVLTGLKATVDFAGIGIDCVKTATGAESAMEILQFMPVDILLTDVEMPGINGLALNQMVKEQYPDTVRILLTSHADFFYAQEGVRLGCFDYLVQPAPAHAIESSLKRAIIKLENDRKTKALGEMGRRYEANKYVFLNTISQKLLYKNPKDVAEARAELREAGYRIHEKTPTQILIINNFEFACNSQNAPSEKEIREAIETSAETVKLSPKPELLLFMDRHRRFLVLLFDEDGIRLPIEMSRLEDFYRQLGLCLPEMQFACYVGTLFPLCEIRNELVRMGNDMRNNIEHTPGIFAVCASGGIETIPTSSTEYIARWSEMLKNHYGSVLKKDIFSYIDSKFSQYPNKYQKLCELHQLLTQMFFRYFYDNSIDVNSLFNDTLSYADYMESYNTIESLKNAVNFLIMAAEAGSQTFPELDYVEKAKTYIMENLSETLSVKDVARHVNLSPEYFTRLFKRSTVTNIKDFIIDCKIMAAKDLLQNSSLPITIIALELGYSNFPYFTQMFKKITNMTPSDFRRQGRSKPDL